MTLGPQDLLVTAVALGALVILVRRVLGLFGAVPTRGPCACSASASCRRHPASTAQPGALIQIVVADRQPQPSQTLHGSLPDGELSRSGGSALPTT